MAAELNTLTSVQVNLADATPMMRQFLEVKSHYPGVLLLYRMGDFYETFFEDALIAAKVLEITLTSREAGKLGRVPMAGIPVKAADAYLPRLMAKNFRVAICEQVEDPAQAKGLVERRVVRVLSAGTLTEPGYLQPKTPQILAAIRPGLTPEAPAGLAWCDVSTGDLAAGTLTAAEVLNELARLQPSEVLVPGRMYRPADGVPERVADLPEWFVRDADGLRLPWTPVPVEAYAPAGQRPVLLRLLQVATLDGLGLDAESQGLAALSALADTLNRQFPEGLPQLDGFQRLASGGAVHLPANTRRNLELTATARANSFEGSLFWLLDQTETAMGGRLMRQWVSRPLTDLAAIHDRLDAVGALVESAESRERLRQALGGVADLERLATRLANRTVQPRELLALRDALARLPQLTDALSTLAEAPPLLQAEGLASPVMPLLQELLDALSDQPPPTLRDLAAGDYQILNPGVSPELDRLRTLLATQNQWLSEFEQAERERTGIRSLKVQFTQAFGFFIEVSKANLNAAPADYQRRQTLTNAERFTTEALKAHEAEVLDAQARRADLELGLFAELRDRWATAAPVLKAVAHTVATLDALASFATVAVSRGYTRPVVDDSLELNLRDSRHPVVEALLPVGTFVPNACVMSAEGRAAFPRMMLITGPNMAGKSTYMRQVAMLVLMAQMGSFVPASYARIGWVDAVFTRVGAVDDLSGGQSTFMVEMTETAAILNSATDRSLVLLDEVGRGTSTFDGVSIAWSVAEYLASEVGCRALFATHYHELSQLETQYAPAVQNVRVCVSETEDQLRFLHTVEPGAAQKSYGLQVARMAGVPKAVLRRAETLLNRLSRQHDRLMAQAKPDPEDLDRAGPQLSLFS